jgi:anti-anti-sigma regulatory factor
MITTNRQLLSGTPEDVRRTMEDLACDQDDHEYLDGTRFRQLAVQLATRDDLAFDMSAVRFMDHRALLALDSYARMCQVPVLLRSMPPIIRRVARVLGLEHVGIVRTGGL